MTGHKDSLSPLEFETRLWEFGLDRIAGIDEAGRGALAGPVVAAAVILPTDPAIRLTLNGVRDSKLMTPLARETWAPRIQATAADWSIGIASVDEIDQLGIVPATKLAALRAIDTLEPEALLTDFLIFPELEILQTALVKGDQRSLSVAAASVLAKTSRDALMCALDRQYPGYGFARHKGYGTRAHRSAVERLGPNPLHRRSFKLI
ncbi:MAG: ribonuclease HII [Anaerolineales bacterium]|nr:ribonuclease HII [Anaerolineales bacterium]